jgi:hypothetical protein
MLALLANGPGPPYLTPDAPAIEWIIWGGCLTVAALLSGWACIGLNRGRVTLPCLALLGALALVAFAALFAMVGAMHREDERFLQREQEKIERQAREAEERSQP